MTGSARHTHIFFDMDGTVTRSRTPITEDLRNALQSLMDRNVDVIIISGQSVEAIRSQVGVGTHFMGQNGNHAVEAQSGVVLWQNALSDGEKKEIMTHIAAMPHMWDEHTREKYIEDRNSQIAYSLIGFKEETSKKETYDPGGMKRTELLKRYPLVSDNVEVKIAGTTTLDYIKKGSHKGTNVEMLIRRFGWRKEDCIYIGDQLYPGGNDEVVLGVIEAKEVQNPSETLAFIRGLD
jgi:HAD superfamily hydrolase (TIGR01484 family)